MLVGVEGWLCYGMTIFLWKFKILVADTLMLLLVLMEWTGIEVH